MENQNSNQCIQKRRLLKNDTSIEKTYRKGRFGGVSKKLRKDKNDPNQKSLFD